MYQKLLQLFAADVVQNCRKGGCVLSLAGIKTPRLVLDLDRHSARCGLHGKTCDYAVIVVSGPLLVAVVEMKGGRNVEARVATAQVQAGARMIEANATIKTIATVDLYPIVLHSGIKHANEYKVFAAQKVAFRGFKLGILLKRCGSRLDDVLRQLM